MTPRINKRAVNRHTVPALSGGVNYRDGISQVMDNQLTDCKNVWFKNGLLKTRPGIVAFDDNPFVFDYYQSEANVKTYAKKENFRVVKGETYFLVAVQSSDGIRFTYYPADKKGCAVEAAFIHSSGLPIADFTCNIFQQGADIYCFCSGYYEGQDIPYYIYKIADKGEFDFNEPLRITNDLTEEEGGFYTPTVAINVSSYIDNAYATKEKILSGATMLEGENLLSNKCRYYTSTVNAKALDINNVSAAMDVPAHYMEYAIPLDVQVRELIPKILKVKLTNLFGTVVHTAKHQIHETFYSENDYNEDDLKMTVFCNGDMIKIAFEHKDNTSFSHYVTEKDFEPNNMEIIVPRPVSKEDFEKVLNMTRSEWFGGSSEGLYGGAHLFLGGNTKQSEKALVCWSDFEKPLYFSESGFAYVGDKSQRVTAFGKQGESLIIFKERETYATQYSGKDEAIDLKKILNGSANAPAETVFLMLQVHGFIGCDCPNTIETCRNRLVWAHSDGKIYTLVSANGWNERSIFEVSGMVDNKIKNHSSAELTSALSADWEGHYILSLGDSFYLMDYNSYGYANVTSYSKSEDAQLHIPWWIWEKPRYVHNTKIANMDIIGEEKPINIISMIAVAGRLYLWAEFEVSKGSYLKVDNYFVPEIMGFDGENDLIPEIIFDSNPETTEQYRDRYIREREISAMAQTKLFDFGSSTISKAVPKSEISFGNNEGVPVRVATLTDRGETALEVCLDFDEANERHPQYFKNVVIRNPEKLVNRIGYRFESDGNLLVDSLAVYYKILRGTK